MHIRLANEIMPSSVYSNCIISLQERIYFHKIEKVKRQDNQFQILKKKKQNNQRQIHSYCFIFEKEKKKHNKRK